jgi:hypothetical protein
VKAGKGDAGDEKQRKQPGPPVRQRIAKLMTAIVFASLSRWIPVSLGRHGGANAARHDAVPRRGQFGYIRPGLM